jgi:hypothetical protein
MRTHWCVHEGLWGTLGTASRALVLKYDAVQDWLVREVISCKPLESWWKEREKDEDG